MWPSERLLQPHLWRVVDDDGMRQIAPQHGKVLQVVALHIDARVAEDAVPDQPPLRVQHIEQLLSVYLQVHRQCNGHAQRALSQQCQRRKLGLGFRV